jgi:type II secretory pathway pseudopilin PulG
VEVFIVVGIVAVLAGLAVPNIASMLERSRVSGEARGLYGMLLEASGEAVREGRGRSFYFNRSTNTWTLNRDANQDGSYSENLESGTLTSEASFGPTSGWGEPFLGAFASIAQDSWCTFCTGDDGTILFERDGSIILQPSEPSMGALLVSKTDEPDDMLFALIFVAPTGEVRLVAQGRD